MAVTADSIGSQARVLTIFNTPTPALYSSEVRVIGVVKGPKTIDVSQVRLLAIVNGRIDNRQMRRWAFNLDGHDFYVIRLGEDSTLVYDLTTGEWADWTSNELKVWRANTGFNWIGMGSNVINVYGAQSRVVVGDDTAGLLWTLDPSVGVDDSVRSDRDPEPFTRIVTGGVPQRLSDTTPVGAVYLTADLGTPQYTTATVTLETSDDNGKTYQDQGTITVEPGNYDQEFLWRSLGMIKAPGRVFRITDNGATIRIDGLDYR